MIDIANLLSLGAIAAVAAVAVATQILKYVPAEWTTRYAVYVNIVVSFLASIAVQGFPLFEGAWDVFLGQWFVIAVAAAGVYHALLKPALPNPDERV